MKRLLAIISCLILGSSLVFAAGSRQGSGGGASNSAPAAVKRESVNFTPDMPAQGFPARGFPKFANPVTVRIAKDVPANDTSLPPGDTVENNQYTRALYNLLNIDVQFDWTASTDYAQKLNLAIATGKIPDVVQGNQAQFLAAYKAGLLKDITGIWKDSISDMVESRTTPEFLAQATIDGRLWAVPSSQVTTDGIHVMMIRQDWLDKLGLPAPRTVSDVARTAKAFMDAGLAKVGIAGPGNSGKVSATFTASYNNTYGFDPIFQAMDAWPGYWVQDASGKINYGTLDPNTKKTLGILADWFKQGLIDPEMGTRKEPGELINSGQAGIFFGTWWTIGYGTVSGWKNDPTMDWQAYPIYSDDSKWNLHYPSLGSNYLLISKNASDETARAAITMLNFWFQYQSIFDQKVQVSWYPVYHLIADVGATETEYDLYFDILEGRAKKEDYNIPSNSTMLKYYNGWDKYYEDTIGGTPGYKKGTPRGSVVNISAFDQEGANFLREYSLICGDRPFATIKPDKIVRSAIYSLAVESMERRWGNLWTLEQEMTMKIVTGQENLDYFDTFVRRWKAEGGDQITAEVQALPR